MAVKKLTELYKSEAADALVEADHTNLAGGQSFTHSLEEQVLRMLTCGTLEDTYYASAEDQAKDAVEAFEQMAAKDTELFARMIIYARNEGLLRSVPITALVVLSKRNVSLMKAIFNRVIRTPNDLRDFVALVRQGNIRQGLGRGVSSAVNRWLNRMSEYHAIKYGSGSNDFSIYDIMRLTHPKPEGEKNTALFKYLAKGLNEENAEAVRSLLPQVSAFESLKKAASPQDQIHYVQEGRLPYEVVVGAVKPSLAMWVELMKQMPYFALLRQLNTLNKHGVFQKAENIEYVAGILTDPVRVKNSKVLPFRFFTAYNTLEHDVPQRIQEAVGIALEMSFDNLPEFTQRIAIGSDVSGSMSSQISAKSKTRYIDICGVFTAAVLKKSKDAIVLPFEDRVHTEVKFSPRDTLLTTARTLSRIGGGGTAVGAPAAYLYEKDIKVDVFIGITDSEDWAGLRGWSRGQGFTNIFREYRRKVNPNAQAFLITISPHKDWMSKEGEPGIHYIYGWNDTVPEYISMMLSGKGNQMDAVRAIRLYEDEPARVEESEE